ncbi:MAG: hypothetical protein SFV15_13160 [Polyangiaceae bacterium]|nr:hypothetical protein [Polyangiaceae bacterium]
MQSGYGQLGNQGLLLVALALGGCGNSQSADEAGGGASGAPGGGDPSAMGTRTVISDPGVPCPEFVPGNALKVCAASYLAGPADDNASAVDFAPDGQVLWAGKISQNNFGTTPVELASGGDGALLHLSADGRKVVSVTRWGNVMNDMQADAKLGNIAVASDLGVGLLAPLGGQLLWSKPLQGAAQRVSVAADGTVAALSGKHVSVFDVAGALLGEFDVSGSTVNDIAIDSGTQNVFVVGFKQDDGAPCTQLQIPFLRAYKYNGALSWKAYDWNHTEVGAVNECADSRGLSVAMGRDGMLYYAGESHGGNTVHRRSPQDLSAMAPVKKFDKYNDPYNLNGAAPIAFYARFKPGDGTLEMSQYLVTRLSPDKGEKGNAARPIAIAADEKGNILLTGAAACCVQDAASKTVNGLPAFSAYLGGGFMLVVSADFSQRLAWTVFDGATGGGTTGVSVATGGGRMALAITQALKESATTASPLLGVDAVQSVPGGGKSDGYFAVWRGP